MATKNVMFCFFTVMFFFYSGYPSLSAETVTGEETGYLSTQIDDMIVNLPSGVQLPITFFAATRNLIHQDEQEASLTQFAYTPLLYFVSFSDGAQNVRYKVYDNHNGTYNIELRLANYNNQLKNAAANWLSTKLGRTVTEHAVQLLPIYQLSITERSSGLKVELPESGRTDTSLIVTPEQTIFFQNLSPADKDRLKENLDSGNAYFVFEYIYNKGSTSTNYVSITYSDIRNTRIFHTLTGRGGSGMVTREGAAHIAREVAQQLRLFTYIEDEGDKADVLTDLKKVFFDKLHLVNEINFENAENLRVLNSLSIDPGGVDFMAQRLNTLHDILKTSHDYQTVQNQTRDLQTEGAYEEYKGKLNFKSDDDVNTISKETFDHDWTGNNWQSVPKTIKLYQINDSDFVSNTVIRDVRVRPRFTPTQKTVGTITQTFPTEQELVRSIPQDLNQSFVLAPIGSVIAYAGPVDSAHSLPTNWKLCDGSPLKKSDYPALFNAIGITYGDGRDFQDHKVLDYDFNLPDYRGYFLRGVAGESHRDPDIALRTAMRQGGNIGDSVGSVQEDAMQSHTHRGAIATVQVQTGSGAEVLRGDDGNAKVGGFTATDGVGTRQFVGVPRGYDPHDDKEVRLSPPFDPNIWPPKPKTGETRPKNVNIYYIIRVR